MTLDQLTAAVMARYEEIKREPTLHVSPIEALEHEITERIAQIKFEHQRKEKPT